MMKKKTYYKLVQNKNRTFAIRMNLLYQRVTHPHIFKMCLLASDHPIKTNREKTNLFVAYTPHKKEYLNKFTYWYQKKALI